MKTICFVACFIGLTAHGVDKKIISALEVVESNNDYSAIGDNGNAVGGLQIWKVVVDDVNRIYGSDYKYHQRCEKSQAQEICVKYLTYYGNRYKKVTGKKPTVDILARIWNGGPSGWKKKSTKNYAKKVVAAYNKING